MQTLLSQAVEVPVKGRKRPVRKSLVRKGNLVRKAPKRRVKVKKKARRKKIDLWREWLVPDGAYHRYEGLRGVYWYWLSRQVRKDEWEKYGGLCLTCLKPIEHWTMGHCGHIIAAQNCGEYLRFLRENLTIQHPHCNSDRITPQAAALNALHYDQRHGQGAWGLLFALKNTEAKAPTQAEYRALIRALPSYQEALIHTLSTTPLSSGVQSVHEQAG